MNDFTAKQAFNQAANQAAKQAAEHLGASLQTLYAYVSRGLLHAQPGKTRRDRRYRTADVGVCPAEGAQGRSRRGAP